MAEARSTVTGSRLPSLTGMRAVAALTVFLSHISTEGFFTNTKVTGDFAFVFIRAGWPGVSFFFILSGFVLTWKTRPEETKRAFWRRRLVKIYPTHVVTWAIALGLMLWAGRRLTAGTAIANLFLVQAWVPRLSTWTTMNDVAWSLCCEALFYFLFPWLHRAMTRIREDRLWWWAVGFISAIVVIPLIAVLLPGQPQIAVSMTPVPRFWFVYVFPPVRALNFVLGIILARVLITGRRVPVGLPVASALAVLAYVVMLFLPELWSMTAVTIVPMALLVLAGARADVAEKFTPWRNRFVVFLGEISFSFYMIHKLVLDYRHRLFDIPPAFSTPVALLVILGFLVLDVLLAWGLYSIVEAPIVRNWSRPQRRQAAPLPQPVR